MTQCNTLNVKLPNLQVNRLKPVIKIGTEVTFKILSNVVDESNDENNFPNKSLLIITQLSRLRQAFTNSSLANVKLSKTHFHKIEQSGGFLGRL